MLNTEPLDIAQWLMLLLVTGLGLVIVRYSRTYLAGDPRLPSYLRWLLATIAAVTVVVVTSNLLVMALAWMATSLSLHRLLTYYPERPAALMAAHKKFLVSRLADAFLAGSLVLVYRDVGTFDLGRIAAWTTARPELTPAMHLAAVFLVLAVALRSAQLPFHGWLMQVMEAPTPVSALLHAGVVNIGGFVLIRLSPWMAHAQAAQLLLVAIGLVSAIVGALVMTTRVSIKVALAWSTCAQMGFMLVQCGLGAWHLALLHLLAHSLYKAHAFLGAGSTVDAWRVRSLSREPALPSQTHLIACLAAGAAVTAIAIAARHYLATPGTGHGIATDVLVVILVLAVLPRVRYARPGTLVSVALRVGGFAALYSVWHLAFAGLLPSPLKETATIGWLVTGCAFTALFVVKTIMQLRPDGALSRRLYPALFAGFYLDERFTRLTFRLWPPRATRPPLAAPKLYLGESLRGEA